MSYLEQLVERKLGELEDDFVLLEAAVVENVVDNSLLERQQRITLKPTVELE